MDISLCIDHLGLNRNEYRLNQSNTPHHITEWIGPDPQPTQEQLQAAWTEIESDPDYQTFLADPTARYPK